MCAEETDSVGCCTSTHEQRDDPGLYALRLRRMVPIGWP